MQLKGPKRQKQTQEQAEVIAESTDGIVGSLVYQSCVFDRARRSTRFLWRSMSRGASPVVTVPILHVSVYCHSFQGDLMPHRAHGAVPGLRDCRPRNRCKECRAKASGGPPTPGDLARSQRSVPIFPLASHQDRCGTIIVLM